MKYTDKNKPLVCMQTQSTCFRGTDRNMTIRGVLWHSTGANNPTLKRYVQPVNDNDTKEHNSNTYTNKEWLARLGVNSYKNDWNHIEREAGLNCWIGELADGTVTTVQTMPWSFKPWGCGGGCNNGWIQFEICEDDLTDPVYFSKVYKEACEITAYLCKMYNINPKSSVKYNGKTVPTILCHQDSYRLGLGSNHSDIYHWFSKYGKNMENVRSDVAALLAGADFTIIPESGNTGTEDDSIGTVVPATPVIPSISTLIKKVSTISTSYDSVIIRLQTSDNFDLYAWRYNIHCLTDNTKIGDKDLKVKDKKTDIELKNLLPDSDYLLTIKAVDKSKNEILMPDYLFSTKNNLPKAVIDQTLAISGTDLTTASCTISFTPSSDSSRWGGLASVVKSKGYRVSLLVNGENVGYSDTLIPYDSTSKKLTLSTLCSAMGISGLKYGDIIQVSILPWICDKNNNYYFADNEAKCTKPIRLAYASNIKNINNFYLKTASGFKRIALFNFGK